MAEPNLCPRCGKPLPQNAVLVGRCPFCLLQRGFESGVENGEDFDAPVGLPDPEAIGRYRVLRRIGEGGMGVVYEAEQDHPRRTVALKIIKPGMASPELLRRFEQESQALGRLQHPGIAQIYEAGTVDTGYGPQPYFAMELIRGKAPREYAEALQLGTRERLEIMAKICDAVHHAHQRGLIHRDLKPANILIDDSGQPKILDFGVARVTDSDARATIQTDMGQLIGTLAYMSPEQVLADPLDIDTRSDVYSLGVILYEFLSGRLPYPISKKIHETIQLIREADPEKFSTANRALRGDIETIVAKALEKDRERRYASAAEMAADIQRYLKDEPIVARPPSASYQLQKFVRRNKALVAGVAATLVVLVAAVAFSTRQASRAMRSDQEARILLDRATKSEQDKTEALVRETEQRHIAETARAEAETQTHVAQQSRSAAEANLYLNNIALAEREWSASNTGNSVRLLDEAPVAHRNWEWNYLDRLNHMEAMAMAGHREAILTMELDTDGRRLRTISADYVIKDWDIRTGTEVASGRFDETVSNNVSVMTMEANGRTLYSKAVSLANNGSGSEIHKFWDVLTGKEVFAFPNTLRRPTSGGAVGGAVFAEYGPAALSPDGSRVVAVSFIGRQTLRSWNAETGRELSVLGEHAGPIRRLSFSPDGLKLALVAIDSTKILNSNTGQELSALDHSRNVNTDVAFSPDSVTIAAGVENEGLRAWKAADGKELWSISSGHVSRVVFSADSRSIAIALTDGTIRILKSTTGREEARLYGNTGDIRVLKFTPDGTQVVSAGGDKLVHIWNLRVLTPSRSFDVGRIEFPLQVSPDVKRLLSSTGSGLKSWDMNTGQLRFTLPFNETGRPMSISKDGNRIAVVNRTDGRGGFLASCSLQVLDAHTGREIAVLHPPKPQFAGSPSSICSYNSVRISPSGDRAAIIFVNLSGLGSSEAFIWNVGTGKLTARLDLDTVVTRAFQFSADGKLAAVTAGLAARNGFVLPAGIDIYNTTTGRRLSRLDVTGLTEIMFSPDGNRLLVVEGERNITLWDVHMGVKLVSLSEPGDTDPRDTVTSIASMDFNPDGTRLVSVSSDGDVWLWDTGSGKALIPLRQSSGPYLVREIPVMAERYGLLSRSTGTKQFSISFSPDGRQITLMTVLSNPKDATIRIETWDGSPRRQ